MVHHDVLATHQAEVEEEGARAPHTGSWAQHTGSWAPCTGSRAPLTGSWAPLRSLHSSEALQWLPAPSSAPQLFAGQHSSQCQHSLLSFFVASCLADLTRIACSPLS
eukprot:28664-Rhodomonas_salina.1